MTTNGKEPLTMRDALSTSPIFRMVENNDPDFLNSMEYSLKMSYRKRDFDALEIHVMFHLADMIRHGKLEPELDSRIPPEILTSVVCMRAILSNRELLHLVKRGKMTYHGITEFVKRK